MAPRLLTFILIFVAALARADFDTAAEAYRNKQYPAAFEAFSELAEAGDARAQTVLAMMYKYGESVPINLEAAFRWYREAARSGYAPAMFNLGEMYRTGAGTNTDPAKAIEWLRRAAEAGYERANESLAKLNAEPVPSEVRADPAVPWSQAWNFRLPNDIRFAANGTDIAPDVAGTIYRAQLGAMRTRASANRLWDWLSQLQPRLFRSLEPIVLLTERDQQQLYRVQAGPFDDLAEVRTFCEQLQRAEPRAECVPVR